MSKPRIIQTSLPFDPEMGLKVVPPAHKAIETHRNLTCDRYPFDTDMNGVPIHDSHLNDEENEALDAGTFVKVEFPVEDAVYLMSVFTNDDGEQIAHIKLIGPPCEGCSSDLNDYYRLYIQNS